MVQRLDANVGMGPSISVRRFVSPGRGGQAVVPARDSSSTAVRAALDDQTRALDVEAPGGSEVARAGETEVTRALNTDRNTPFLRQPGHMAAPIGAVVIDAVLVQGSGNLPRGFGRRRRRARVSPTIV